MPAAPDGPSRNRNAALDGAALTGVTGLGVGEHEVLVDVGGREADLSSAAGDDDASVAVDGVDGPAVAVLDHELPVRLEPAVVVAGGDARTISFT